MKLASTLLAAGLAAAALGAAPQPAGAKVGIYLDTPGLGLYLGPRYRYYEPYNYYPYYPGPYYGPYYYRPYYAPPVYRPRNCGYWADECAYRWGWRGKKWRRCMRNHGCR